MALRVKNKEELLVLVEDYLDKSGLTATKFGWLATGDLSLVTKLRRREGYDPNMSTVTRVLEYLEQATEPAQPDFAEGL